MKRYVAPPPLHCFPPGKIETRARSEPEDPVRNNQPRESHLIGGVVARMRPNGGRGERAAADANRTQRDQHRVAVHLIQSHDQNAHSATRMERVSWVDFAHILHIRTLSMVAALRRQRDQQQVAVHLPFRHLLSVGLCIICVNLRQEILSLFGVKANCRSLWARSFECAPASHIKRGSVWRASSGEWRADLILSSEREGDTHILVSG